MIEHLAATPARSLPPPLMDMDSARPHSGWRALNVKLGTVIRDMEETGDAMVALIDESQRQSGYWLVEMFKRLIQQAKRWRALKANAAAMAAEVPSAQEPPTANGSLP